MTVMVDPITDEEMIGYFAAMLTDQPWGEPATSLDELEIPSGSRQDLSRAGFNGPSPQG